MVTEALKAIAFGGHTLPLDGRTLQCPSGVKIENGQSA